MVQKNDIKYILVHTTGLAKKILKEQLKQTNDYHHYYHPDAPFPISSRGFFVGYHILLTNGRKVICRDDTDIGAHCNTVVDGKSMNVQSLAVALAQDGDVELPNADEIILLRKVIKEWQKKWNIPDANIKYHRDFTNRKTCPGKLWTKEYLKTLLLA